jgi:hypothetical protein
MSAPSSTAGKHPQDAPVALLRPQRAQQRRREQEGRQGLREQLAVVLDVRGIGRDDERRDQAGHRAREAEADHEDADDHRPADQGDQQSRVDRVGRADQLVGGREEQGAPGDQSLELDSRAVP